MTLVGLIDTNLFKKLTKNTGGIHDVFVKEIGTEVATTTWSVTHFGWLEYLGLPFRKSLQVDPMPAGWTLPDSIRDQYKQSIEGLGHEFATHCFWVRSKAKEKYQELLTTEVLDEKAEEEQRYHSEAFTDGPFIDPLFLRPLATYHPDAIAELLAIDYVHRYPDFPPNMNYLFRDSCRMAPIAEYYVERRNVVLFRVFKQAWFHRLKGSHESHVAQATMAQLEGAMSRLKNHSDRFDHDLLAYFLLGFALNGEYEPVTIYSQDDPSEVLSRLAIFYCILRFTWEEWAYVDGVGPLPVQRASRFRFVCDHGYVLHEISSHDLGGFLLDEGLIVRQ